MGTLMLAAVAAAAAAGSDNENKIRVQNTWESRMRGPPDQASGMMAASGENNCPRTQGKVNISSFFISKKRTTKKKTWSSP